jgi:hypothetical protein
MNITSGRFLGYGKARDFKARPGEVLVEVGKAVYARPADADCKVCDGGGCRECKWTGGRGQTTGDQPMSPQQQEELDYQMGCATEQQNAYALSCIDRKPDDMGKINELVAQGRFCAVARGPEYCRFTDALLPGGRCLLVGDFASRAEAEAALAKDAGDDPDPEVDYFVLPYPQPVAPT